MRVCACVYERGGETKSKRECVRTCERASMVSVCLPASMPAFTRGPHIAEATGRGSLVCDAAVAVARAGDGHHRQLRGREVTW
jgi:hypothetical protein